MAKGHVLTSHSLQISPTTPGLLMAPFEKQNRNFDQIFDSSSKIWYHKLSLFTSRLAILSIARAKYGRFL
jgi:hypothetical protein